MAETTNVAIHIEAIGDVAEITAKAAKLATELDATILSATVSTHERVRDLSEPEALTAETVDGKTVLIKNPRAHTLTPKEYEPVPHRDPDGEWRIEVERDAKEGAHSPPPKYRRLTEAELAKHGIEVPK